MDDGLARLTQAGDYCLVVSRTATRPRNGNIAHHVNWLPFGVLHDNVLIERNMLPDPNFANSIQKAAAGTEAQTLGAYFPSAAYMTVADFEKQGCPGLHRVDRLRHPAGRPAGDDPAQHRPGAAPTDRCCAGPPGRGLVAATVARIGARALSTRRS